MKRFLTYLLLFWGVLSVSARVNSFEDAKMLSVSSGKPILLEFIHKGCEYCAMAAQHQENSQAVKDALARTIHIIFDVNEGEGVELSDRYNVGIYYPVFVLANSQGDEIYQWFGYNKNENHFINMLNTALAQKATIKERIARHKNRPNARDAVFLAKYYADTRDNLKAVEYYRQGQQIDSRYNYRMQIFKNMAQAAYADKIAYDAVPPLADSVLAFEKCAPYDSVEVAVLITRLARAKGETDRVEKYLQAGIDATSGSQVKKMVSARHDLMADYTLHIREDTVRAIMIKKASMGEGWESDRDSFYDFAEWCLERKINLEEAENYARKTINLVYAGKYRAKVLNTVAEICDARGKTDEAVKIINLAINEDPDNEFYVSQLEKYIARARRD